MAKAGCNEKVGRRDEGEVEVSAIALFFAGGGEVFWGFVVDGVVAHPILSLFIYLALSEEIDIQSLPNIYTHCLYCIHT